MSEATTYDADVIIVGGGPAGLTAALYLGRACKQVLVLDGGSPRHAVSEAVHNVLTRDGMPPAHMREVAWAQMASYPQVAQVADIKVEAMTWREDRWHVRTDEGRTWTARAVLLATGVIDEHPDIPGYHTRWGTAIHHCPYCHGWEMRHQPLAALAEGEAAVHMGRLLGGWSDDVVVVTHGRTLEPEIQSALTEHGIAVYTQTIAALEGADNQLEVIRFKDGSHIARRGLFVVSSQRQVPLIHTLGLTLNEEGYVEVDAQQRATDAPMLWAAGDLTSRMQQVLEAAAQGGRAGACINMALTMP